MLGPTGVGVLYGKYKHLEAMPPFLYGGEMVKAVERASAVYSGVPHKFEAGTPDIAGVIGLGVAIDYLTKLGMNNIHAQEQRLVKYAIQKLSKIKGLKIHGPLDSKKRGGAISFSVSGIHPHDLASLLDEQGIAIRSGHHCAMPLHLRLTQIATARASLYFYNTNEEIDKLVAGIKYAQKLFKVSDRPQ